MTLNDWATNVFCVDGDGVRWVTVVSVKSLVLKYFACASEVRRKPNGLHT